MRQRRVNIKRPASAEGAEYVSHGQAPKNQRSVRNSRRACCLTRAAKPHSCEFDIRAAASPPDVRRGSATPEVEKIFWGCAPGSAFGPDLHKSFNATRSDAARWDATASPWHRKVVQSLVQAELDRFFILYALVLHPGFNQSIVSLILSQS